MTFEVGGKDAGVFGLDRFHVLFTLHPIHAVGQSGQWHRIIDQLEHMFGVGFAFDLDDVATHGKIMFRFLVQLTIRLEAVVAVHQPGLVVALTHHQTTRQQQRVVEMRASECCIDLLDMYQI